MSKKEMSQLTRKWVEVRACTVQEYAQKWAAICGRNHDPQSITDVVAELKKHGCYGAAERLQRCAAWLALEPLQGLAPLVLERKLVDTLAVHDEKFVQEAIAAMTDGQEPFQQAFNRCRARENA